MHFKTLNSCMRYYISFCKDCSRPLASRYYLVVRYFFPSVLQHMGCGPGASQHKLDRRHRRPLPHPGRFIWYLFSVMIAFINRIIQQRKSASSKQ